MKNTKTTKDMSLDEIVRWSCLVEAISVADAQMINHGIDPEKFDWVKPIAIEKYIDERFHSMKHDIVYEMINGTEQETEEDLFFKSN
jgi:hypothetical protein